MTKALLPAPGNLIVTFADCPTSYKTSAGRIVCDYSDEPWSIPTSGWYCDRIRSWGKCPRGFS
jgi:hypothetical protein